MKKNKAKKVIVITGGNSGLGKATAKLLAEDNTVVILGKNEKEVTKVSESLGCQGLVCDITDRAQVKQVVLDIIKKNKKIDTLINNAGVWIKGAVDENTPEEIENAIMVNVAGVMFMTNMVVPYMKKRKSGRIINISSQAGLYAKAGRSVYNASKWAVTGYTKSIQPELAPFNISVVGFYPGFIHTGLFKKAKDTGISFASAMKVEKVAKSVVYLVELDDDLVVKEYGIKSIKQV